MKCSQCQAPLPAGAERCPQCGTPLAADDQTGALPPENFTELPTVDAAELPTVDSTGVRSWHTSATADAGAAAPALQSGAVLSGRYRILKQLGVGGMGEVFQATDMELDRLVALKVIRPDLASKPQTLKRFKQELILARQITHRNVIRIFDMGQAGSIRFITMEYVEGQDLKTFLSKKGSLPVNTTVGIIQQICLALEAAHQEGVVHRDLKPQNIMVDTQDRVVVMDFGLARSVQLDGMTQTGAVLGTPEYMSPEQVKGDEADARSDIFALGIIFYHLLTGKVPYQANTPMATMYKRTKERATPPISLNREVPAFLNDVVLKCLEPSAQRRYQSTREILHDLEAWRGGASRSTVAPVVQRLRRLPLSGKWLAAGLAAVVLALAGLAVVLRPSSVPTPTAAVPTETVSLAILPFRNSSGDTSLDWLGPGLADMLRTDIGQSAHLRIVSPDRLHQILQDLRISPDTSIDPAMLRRIADFSNAGNIVWGKYLKIGDQIRIDATIEDFKRQRSIPVKTEAPSEEQLLGAVEKLAQEVQENLALSAEQIQELQAASFSLSSESVQALRYYSEGLELSRQGNNLEAVKRFEASVEEDPDFALAYSKLGQAYASLGYGREAEQFSRQAVELSHDLPPQEKYLIMADSALIENDFDKGIESYEQLAAVLPADPEVNYNLAALYEASSSLDQAGQLYAKVLEADPKNVSALLARGRVAIKSGKTEDSLDYLNRGLSLAVQLDNKEAKANILQAIGIAYKLLGRPEDALRNYQESLAIKREIGDRGGMAVSLSEIAQIQEYLGDPVAAREGYLEAIRIQEDINDQSNKSISLINLADLMHATGELDEALRLTKEALQILAELADDENQARCLNSIGSLYVIKGQYDDAVIYYERALQLREKLKAPSDIADTLHNLAEVSAKKGRYKLALDHYLRAVDLRREAGDQRGVARESYGMGTLFADQGRYGAALSAMDDATRQLQELQDRTDLYAEVLAGRGHALVQVGMGDTAKPILDEALTLARELENNAVAASALNSQGHVHFYRGDLEAAGELYSQALETARNSEDPHLILGSRINAARILLDSGRHQEALTSLEELAGEARTLGLRALAVESSVYRAEALLRNAKPEAARQLLETVLRQGEEMELRPLLVKIHYLTALALRASGDEKKAKSHLQETFELLQEMQQESRIDQLLERADLRLIYEEASQVSASSS